MTHLAIGDAFIDFTLPATDGKTYHASELVQKARAFLVIFSCNHCPYVQAWEDRMNAIARDYANDHVYLVAINPNDVTRYPSDSWEQMIQRANEKQFEFPYLYDEAQSVAHAYGAERTPEVFLFDTAGKLRYHGAIDDNYEHEEEVQHRYVRDALAALLAEKEVAIPETKPVGCTVKWKKE